MTTPPTSRFTLPDPNRPRAPSLPVEIVLHILSFAQEGDSPLEQLRTKLRVERVCKAWLLEEYRWNAVALDRPARAQSLLNALKFVAAGGRPNRLKPSPSSARARDDVVRRIKTVHLALTNDNGSFKLRDQPKLLGQLKFVENVSMTVRNAFALNASSHSLAALSTLSNVKRFTVAPLSAESELDLGRNWLTRLVSKWTQLESIDVARLSALQEDAGGDLFLTSPSLRSVRLIHTGEALFHPKSIVARLPPTVRELTVESEDLFKQFSPTSRINATERLIDHASQLRKVALRDGSAVLKEQRGYAPWGVMLAPTLSRGQLDNFVKHLTSVTHLTISPVAIADLATLADLPALTQLELRFGRYPAKTPVKPTELVNLFERTASLKQVKLSKDIHKAWSDKEVTCVGDAAGRKVALEWV